MERPGTSALFQHESADSLARFLVLIGPLAGGGVVCLLAIDLLGWPALLAVIGTCLVLAAGLRAFISVHPGRVQIVKKWFFIPYRTYTAACIEDVSFGGDWGLDDGAIGVVVRMGGHDIHIGTSKNMHSLYDALRRVGSHQEGPSCLA